MSHTHPKLFPSTGLGSTLEFPAAEGPPQTVTHSATFSSKRYAPEHAHHAVVQLEGRAPWTKFRVHSEG